MNWELSNILRINQERLTANNQEYNPLVGTPYCDEIERVRVEIPDAPIPVQYVPKEMEGEKVFRVVQKAGTMMRSGAAVYGGAGTRKKAIKVWQHWLKSRCKHDFEFWCATQIKIKIKGKPERNWFILNRAQRFYLRTLERLRKEGVPIDVVLLKARQWGGSTMTQLYMFWIQKMWRTEWNSVICGAVKKQSRVVQAMLENAAKSYDTFIDDGEPTILRPYGRTTSIREIVGRGCTISIGSAEEPDKIRCEDISLCHLTEYGLWKSTPSKSPEDVIETIQGAMLSGPYTLFVVESTAKGVGNPFHNMWLDAVDGNNSKTPVFVPWFMIDIYTDEIKDYEKFIESMSPYEKRLFELGATLEAVHWYRCELRRMGNDEARMKSEYPSTPEEAFQSTGNNYFPDEYLDEMMHDCCEPSLVGEIVGAAEKGTDALTDVRIVSQSNGNLKVWADVDRNIDMRNRYLVTVDLGCGHTATADNSIICVFDRYWQMEPTGIPEVVAEWAGHLDMDLIAWKAAQLAHYYNDALLVIENNSLIMSGVQYFMGVLVEIKDYYPNLWKRTVSNKIDPAGRARYGWRTDGESKPRICLNLLSAIRDGMYIEHCKQAVMEMKVFEEKPNGELGAVDGNHDDRVITRAIGVTFMYDRNLMEAPCLFDKSKESSSYSRTIVNEFS